MKQSVRPRQFDDKQIQFKRAFKASQYDSTFMQRSLADESKAKSYQRARIKA